MTSVLESDAEVREEIRTNLDENLAIEAGAGTGKTTSLVARIVEILATGRATADSVVAITFTEAAAAELSARVREGIEDALANGTDATRSDRLELALRSLHRGRIETIHAFCASLLQERPVEARLDPEFTVLADLEAELSFNDAYVAWVDDLLTGEHPEVAEALNVGLSLGMIRAAAETVHRFRFLLPLGAYPKPNGKAQDAADWLKTNVPTLEGIRDRCLDEADRGLPVIEDLIRFQKRLLTEGTTPTSLARILATATHNAPSRGRQSSWEDKQDCIEMKELFKEWNVEIHDQLPEALRAKALLDVLPHIERFVLDYSTQRQREGVADFDDILIWARDLLKDNIEVRRYFQRRFDCLLIDEFQDTDPIQVEIATFLTSDDQDSKNWRELHPAPGKLFVVGDPKQSIYRFRRADIGIYDAVKREMLADGVREITRNFRSLAPVIEWVNRVFDSLFVEQEGVQPRNVALVPGAEQADLLPPILVIRDSNEDSRNAQAEREREAAAIAAVLDDAVRGQTPWQVRDRESRSGSAPRPADWRDIAILLPARTALGSLEDALAALDIPHRHEGSRDYFQRQEVRDFVHLLAAIDDPSDKLSVIGALRSGAFGCSDADLVEHLATGGYLNYRAQGESENGSVMAAFELMKSWNSARRGLSVGELVSRSLTESKMVEFALTLPDGAQAAANLLAIADRAREFTAAGGGGPRPFIRWLVEHSERQVNEVDTGISEEKDNVVRLMTMHGSKGLEYPIVALAGLGTKGRNQREPVPDEETHRLHFYVGNVSNAFGTPDYDEEWENEKDALAAEGRRLLYVAATRARDHLIVPALSREPQKGSALEALEDLLPNLGQHAEVVDDTLLLDAEKLELAGPAEIESFEPADAADAKSARIEREGWENDRVEATKVAREELTMTVASSVKRTVRPLAAEASHSASAMLMSEGPPLEVGDALHLVMERVTLPAADDLDQVAESVCLEAGIPQHTEEVLEMARRCLESPVMHRALASGAIHREVPFMRRSDDGYETGRVDLLFTDEQGTVIVDYKTDQVEPASVAAHAVEHYSGQVATYEAGLSSALRRPISNIVLIYARPGIEATLHERISR